MIILKILVGILVMMLNLMKEKRGYAKQMLSMSIPIAKDLGIKEILLVCKKIILRMLKQYNEMVVF
jgi:hypothetical protein